MTTERTLDRKLAVPALIGDPSDLLIVAGLAGTAKDIAALTDESPNVFLMGGARLMRMKADADGSVPATPRGQLGNQCLVHDRLVRLDAEHRVVHLDRVEGSTLLVAYRELHRHSLFSVLSSDVLSSDVASPTAGASSVEGCSSSGASVTGSVSAASAAGSAASASAEAASTVTGLVSVSSVSGSAATGSGSSSATTSSGASSSGGVRA